jgi:hypothetical protein
MVALNARRGLQRQATDAELVGSLQQMAQVVALMQIFGTVLAN